jgi:transposase
VTRLLLWQEYKAQHPEGLQYSAFCDHLRAFLNTREPVMRFEHRAGDKCFVDYAGQTAEVIDRYTGEIRAAQIFVAVLGCSNYTYAEASWTQSLPDWLGAHVRALEFFGGAPAAFVPDNLKSGVDKSHRYDPDLNRAYAEFAEHYGVAILPARVRRPRDKSKVETGVQIVERWILARLRNRQFFSLAELNAAISAYAGHASDRNDRCVSSRVRLVVCCCIDLATPSFPQGSANQSGADEPHDTLLSNTQRARSKDSRVNSKKPFVIKDPHATALYVLDDSVRRCRHNRRER